jgi:hypothetical protein
MPCTLFSTSLQSPLLRRRRPHVALFLAGLALPLAGHAHGPQEPPPVSVQGPDSLTPPRSLAPCSEGRVSRVFIDNHSVFDPASIPDDPRIRWAYRAANRVHMRTREGFISDELLLRPGDCYDPLLARESARILREFRFIAWADAFSVPQPDGTRHLVVETRDEWTTKVAGDVAFEGGFELRGLQLVEENFLGRGISIGAYFSEEDERRDVGGLFELPRLGRTNWDLALSGSRTRVGNAWSQAVIHPFIGEVGTFAFRQRATSRRDLFTWVLPEGEPWSHLVVPVETGRVEAALARRYGATGRFLLVGAGFSREWVRPGGVPEVEGVVDGSFDERSAVPEAVGASVASQLLERDATRLSLLVGVRRVTFVDRIGLDVLAGVQDVPVGGELLLSIGPSVGGGGRLDPDTRERNDLFTRGDLFAGFATGPLVGQLHLALEGRRVRGQGMRDVLGEAHAFFYHQARTPFRHTLVLRMAAQGDGRPTGPSSSPWAAPMESGATRRWPSRGPDASWARWKVVPRSRHLFRNSSTWG